MYIVKIKQETSEVFNKICRSFIACYIDNSLEIASSIIRIPSQEEFFNILPLLRQARSISNSRLQLYPVGGGIEEELKFEKEEENTLIEEPYTYLSIIESDRPLISNKPANVCIVVGIEVTKSTFSRPFIEFLGAKTYPNWAFTYSALDKLIGQHNNLLTHMELDLIDAAPDTKTADEILEGLKKDKEE